MFRPVTPVSSTPVSTGAAKHQQVISEESIFNRLMEEIRCINHALEAIRSDQQRIEVTLY